MAVGDVCVLRIVGRYQQQNCVSSLHYRITTQVSDDLDILGQLIDDWLAIHEVAWLNCHIDTYTLVGYKAFRVDGTAKVPAYSTVETAGNVDDDEVPSNLCRTITFYTASSNHRRRGRIMLSGSGQAMFNQGHGSVAVAAVAILQTLADLLETALAQSPDEFELVLPAANGDPIEPIVAARARVTPSALKSRRVKQYLIG